MLTQKQYCKSIIENYCNSNQTEVDKITREDIIQSSSLAIALEYLGLLTDPQMQEYTKTRAGFVAAYYDASKRETASLSVRELINLLPNE